MSARELRTAIEAEALNLARLQALIALAAQGAEAVDANIPDPDGGVLAVREALDHLSTAVGEIKIRLYELAEEPKRAPPGPRKRKTPPLSVVRTEAAA